MVRCRGRLGLLSPWVLVGVAAAATACDAELASTAEWLPAASIAPPLEPELGGPALPTALRPASLAPLRVVSYNVELGADLDGLAHALADEPTLAGAGLVLLQEIESHPDEGRSRTAELADRLGRYFVYAPSRTEGDGTHGLAILSAFPIDDVSVMWLPRADVPRTGRPRIALAADVRIGERRVRVVNLHLDTTLNVDERLVHLRPAVIDQPDVTIVGGDFNTNDFVWAEDTVPLLPLDSALDTRQVPVIDELMARLGFVAATAAFGPTEVHLGVAERLDSIYVRGLKPGDGAVERAIEVSDHWPLWLDVALP